MKPRQMCSVPIALMVGLSLLATAVYAADSDTLGPTRSIS
jgi:hypothetical protein